MSKNKFKHVVTPKKMLMETYNLDEASVTVLSREVRRVNITFSCEDNVLYAINNDNTTKIPVSQHEYVLSKINVLQKFIGMQDKEDIITQYLYEKIKGLESKISDLEQENKKLTDDIWNLENKNSTYHD